MLFIANLPLTMQEPDRYTTMTPVGAFEVIREGDVWYGVADETVCTIGFSTPQLAARVLETKLIHLYAALGEIFTGKLS